MPTADRDPSVSVSNGRDAKGRFGPHNRCGKGNPNLIRIHEFKNQFIQAVNTDRWNKICESLLTQAENGDHDSIKLVFNYLLGKPHQMVTVEAGGDNSKLLEEFRSVVERVIAPYPDARRELARAFRELADREESEESEGSEGSEG